ncbi:PKD domain-containing protein [Flaviaesturariibacter terrae]
MRRRYLCFSLLVFLYFFHADAGAQCPVNLGFEQGNFGFWQCATGQVSATGGINQMTLTPSAPMIGHHSLADSSEPADDPYGEFPMVCPYGGRYSVQLGNDGTGHEADALSYTFVVPSNLDTFTITFFYAVVLQNPGHAPYEQPRFTVTARNEGTGTVVNCSDFDFVATGGIPGFKSSRIDGTVVYKEWTPASLQFAGMAGQTITLEFRVSDCTRGGHFGYAYVDVSESCNGQLATAPYCPAANAIVLNAPYGFETYTWYNRDFSQVLGFGQSVTLSPPPPGADYFWVSMEPYPGYGCPDTVKAVVTPYPVPAPPSARDYYYCLGQPSTPLAATALPGHVLQWYLSQTDPVGATTAPTPPTTAVGTKVYWVAQKQLFGCESLRVPVTVHIIGSVPLAFTVSNDRQCLAGNQFTFTNNAPAIGNSPYYWDFGDGGSHYATPGGTTTYSYFNAGSYTAKLILRNAGACSDTAEHPVVVVATPVALIGGPQAICVGAAGATLSDSTQLAGSTITQWWWNVGGVVSNASSAPLPSSAAGPVPVAFAVTSAEGCRSDTTRVLLPVHSRPVAAFDFSGHCDNEPLRLRDRSFQPLNTQGEILASWQWSDNGAPISTTRSPDVFLSGGTHHVRLVVANNFGCSSDPADSSVTLLAHPQVQVSYDDSCAGRPIVFTASIRSGTVRDWRWNFGTGTFNGGPVVPQTFLQAGIRHLQLLAIAPDGCRDTVERTVPVLINTAWAGRDTAGAYGEPVLLFGHGDTTMRFTWTPANALLDPATQRPSAVWPDDLRYELYAVDRFGCESRSSVLVRRYLGPELFVPNAFTPNGDGRNDQLVVRPVGIRTLSYFAIYDRRGQLLYRSTDVSKGWDGTFQGVALASQTFVFVAEGIDYKGQRVFRKGTVTLLR